MPAHLWPGSLTAESVHLPLPCTSRTRALRRPYCSDLSHDGSRPSENTGQPMEAGNAQ